MPTSFQSTAELESEIESRLGWVPNLFRSAPSAPELPRQLWQAMRGDFLDNPLPPLFKQRLMVYLARLCGARYCLVLHAGLLTGQGLVAGDATVAHQGREELLSLLAVPLPDSACVSAALAELQSGAGAQQHLPASGDALERALFIACGAICRDLPETNALRDSLYHLLGRQCCERIFQLIGHALQFCSWARLHPEIAIDPYLRAAFERDAELSWLLLESAVGAPMPPGGTAAAPHPAVAESDLIPMLNHELRTPVAAISAVADMLQMIAGADERLGNALQILQRQVGSMTTIMDRALDLSDLASGALTLSPTPTPVDTALHAALRELKARIDDRKMQVELQLPERACVVAADPLRLQQLFENLLGHMLTRSKSGSALVIAVEANAAATSVRFLLPQPPALFRAAGGAPTARMTAATISLALAKLIAEMHEGTLEAIADGDSNAGYLLTLPHGDARAGAQDAGATGIRVLSIEDNHDFAQLFQHMLEIMGCELSTASDAETGLQRARETAPQLIFCDIGLPGQMDGYDFARSLRADPRLAPIPLVAVSAYCSPSDVQQAHEAGFDRVCGKPVKYADISAALAAFSNGTLRKT
jgi:CheY-like chemotaxis protein